MCESECMWVTKSNKAGGSDEIIMSVSVMHAYAACLHVCVCVEGGLMCVHWCMCL